MKGDDYSKETLITDSSEHWTIFSSSFGMDQVIFIVWIEDNLVQG